MSYTQDLALRYTQAHKRLMGYANARQRYIATPPIPEPPPPRIKPKLSPESPQIIVRPTLEQLVLWVAAKERITPQEITGRRRDSRVVRPRKILYYLAYRYTGETFTKIAKYCNRDHTTVIDGFYRVCASIEEDALWCAHIRKYTDQIDLQIESQSKICPLCGK